MVLKSPHRICELRELHRTWMVVIQIIEQVLAIMLKLEPYDPSVDLFGYLSKLTQLNRTTIIGIMFQEELVAYFIRQGDVQVLQSNFQARHI